jgi:hypothetical protein
MFMFGLICSKSSWKRYVLVVDSVEKGSFLDFSPNRVASARRAVASPSRMSLVSQGGLASKRDWPDGNHFSTRLLSFFLLKWKDVRVS